MIVFPAIDIQNGHAVRLRQGVKEDSTTYFDDPVEAAVKWCEEGALFLHVVDLDGAFSGSRCNAEIIGKICDAVDIPVEVGGGIRSEEAIQSYLDVGVNRVIIGSKAVEDEAFIGSNCNIFAPVKIGRKAYICAGTTVTKDVPEGSFVIGRVRQENKERNV